MHLRQLFISLASLGLCASACATPPVYPISTAQVALAVFAAHPEIAAEAIEVPVAVAAHTQNPALEAGPVEHWASAGAVAHVRLRCIHPGDCLPFYATVRSVAVPSRTVQGALVQTAPSTPASEAEFPTAVHSGAHVFLLIDSGRLHLRLPATALGSGAAGSTVRVTGPARGKVYQALVVDSTTVRGTL